MSSINFKRRKNPMLVSKPSECSMQCSKKSYSNRLQIKEIGLSIKQLIIAILVNCLFNFINCRVKLFTAV